MGSMNVVNVNVNVTNVIDQMGQPRMSEHRNVITNTNEMYRNKISKE